MSTPPTLAQDQPPRRRGRPRKQSPPIQWLTLAEAAHILDMSPERLHRFLEIAAGSFLPNATKDADTWKVPASDLPGRKPFLRLADASKILRVPVSTLRHWAVTRKIPATRLPNGSFRIRPEDFEAITTPAPLFL